MVCGVSQSKSAISAPNLTTLVRGASLENLKPSRLFKKSSTPLPATDEAAAASPSRLFSGSSSSSLLLMGAVAAAAAATVLLSRSKLRA
jgi:hypothetical protein